MMREQARYVHAVCATPVLDEGTNTFRVRVSPAHARPLAVALQSIDAPTAEAMAMALHTLCRVRGRKKAR